MTYLKEDFNHCKYNPFVEDLGTEYPELLELFGTLGTEKQKMVKYAIACYDPKSPLIQDYPDWLRRKEAAAYIAGYDLDKDGRYLAGVFSGTDDDALGVIHFFLRNCIRSREWAMIVSNEETFWEYNMRLKIPIAKGDKGDKDMMGALQIKTKLTEDQEMFHERIKRLTKEFFGGDEELTDKVENNFKMNPQQIAKQLSKK